MYVWVTVTQFEAEDRRLADRKDHRITQWVMGILINTRIFLTVSPDLAAKVSLRSISSRPPPWSSNRQMQKDLVFRGTSMFSSVAFIVLIPCDPPPGARRPTCLACLEQQLSPKVVCAWSAQVTRLDKGRLGQPGPVEKDSMVPKWTVSRY